jgi:hypothetical protein
MAAAPGGNAESRLSLRVDKVLELFDVFGFGVNDGVADKIIGRRKFAEGMNGAGLTKYLAASLGDRSYSSFNGGKLRRH